MKRYLTALTLTAALAFAATLARPPAATEAAANDVIKVEGGMISGTTADGVRTYKGIPFAAPPVGELRWKAPQPVISWEGVRACDRFGPECPQAPYPAGSI